MEYHERVRELREEHNFTQTYIASLLNIGQRTYSDYESGRTRIPLDRVRRLAEYYNVSMDYISCASNERREYPTY